MQKTYLGRSGLCSMLLALATMLGIEMFDARQAARAQGPAGCAAPVTEQALDTTAPMNIELLRRYLIAYRCTHYDSDVATALSQARAWVEARAPQVVKPAIVLDIDETSLSNWEQIYHNSFAYFPSGACDFKGTAPCGQSEWEMSAEAGAIKPTLDLFNFAKSLHGKDGEEVAVFFVTGRFENPVEKAATEWNLQKAGYADWTHLYLRPEASRADRFVSCHKTHARQDIENQGYTIIANVGDQQSDLVGAHAEKGFKVPNPFYFIDGGTDADLGCGP